MIRKELEGSSTRPSRSSTAEPSSSSSSSGSGQNEFDESTLFNSVSSIGPIMPTATQMRRSRIHLKTWNSKGGPRLNIPLLPGENVNKSQTTQSDKDNTSAEVKEQNTTKHEDEPPGFRWVVIEIV